MNDVFDRTRMFAAVPHDVIDRLKNANSLALYTILKRYAGANSKAHPGRKKLAEDMGVSSVKTVDRVLEDLRRAGLVKTFPRFKSEDGHVSHRRDDQHRTQTSNGYVILDPLDTGVPTPGHECPYPLDTGVPTRGTPVTHEVDTPEVDTSEVDPPVVPQRGTGDGGEVALIEEPEAKSSYPAAFERWWDDYPKKTGKRDAYRKWTSAKKGIGADELHTRLLDRLPGLIATQQRDPRYVPNPATWLNQGRYDDLVEEVAQPMSQTQKRQQSIIDAANQLFAQEVSHDRPAIG